eukprot:CAMPEP_0183346446 /NCGR_PEP_ID=MMETSP0164_2-20130417/11565_1 /TAXON_ID=221442 /ORGANISM="Coccolithus pelagicus ssp braarudi, Strain PLY182g" /LENGTH=643 /DNA_ID=CAMNT_0025517725 /DNA_START=11 /DNA_END=1943 /DNA_ORIENTATION=-
MAPRASPRAKRKADDLEPAHSVRRRKTAPAGVPPGVTTRAERRQSIGGAAAAELTDIAGTLRAELAASQDDNAALTADIECLQAARWEAEEAKRLIDLEFRSYKEQYDTSSQQQVDGLRTNVERLTQQVAAQQEDLVAREAQAAESQRQIDQLCEQLMDVESARRTMHQQLLDAENARRVLHNAVQELKGNIRVFCRVRPASGDAVHAIDVSDSSKLCLKHSSDSYSFSFDKVFEPSAAQAAVFEEVDGLVQSALDGYKVCIFAYGQTGSGKTYTMQGNPDPASWGLIPRSLSKILDASHKMRADGWAWNLEASFLEVYNETLRDLLNNNNAHNSSLAIKHEEAWGTVVTGLSREEVSSMEEINALMVRAAKQRAVGSTDMNAQSSRSHSVFALYLKGRSPCGTELSGALHLVDLAGSERLDKSGATGAALRETQNINKSLSSLSDVFAAKVERRTHVPFRNSKLTYLMEPCLSGNGKTLMVVNVAPELDNSHETLCSLRFASQVNQCDTGGKPKRTSKNASAVSGAKNRGNPARPQACPSGEPSELSTLRRLHFNFFNSYSSSTPPTFFFIPLFSEPSRRGSRVSAWCNRRGCSRDGMVVCAAVRLQPAQSLDLALTLILREEASGVLEISRDNARFFLESS